MLSKSVAAGDAIFSEGDGADAAYLIESGIVEIWLSRKGERHPVARLGPGEVFGEMGLIDGAPRASTAEAVTACRLAVVSPEHIQQAIARSDPFFAELIRKMAGRLRHTQSALAGTGIEPELQSAELGPGYTDLLRERDIAEAIITGTIEPFLQPVVRLADGIPIGYEVLARWRSDRFGLLRPYDFLPLARRTGLIRRIDLTMADRALAICSRLGQDGPAPYVSINISAWHFRSRTLNDALGRMIEQHGVRPSRLCVEITETELIEDITAAEVAMNELRRTGIRMALDDFGTGFSSLNLLHRLPFDMVKVDGTLVDGAQDSARQRALLRGIGTLCRDLGIEVVAEGVETADTVRTLLDLGFDLGQGLHFAPPTEAEQAIVAWRERSPAPS